MAKASPRLVQGFQQAPQVGRNYACQPGILPHRMLLSQIAQHRATQHLTTQHNTAQHKVGGASLQQQFPYVAQHSRKTQQM
jgi:hypothetical protein